MEIIGRSVKMECVPCDCQCVDSCECKDKCDKICQGVIEKDCYEGFYKLVQGKKIKIRFGNSHVYNLTEEGFQLLQDTVVCPKRTAFFL